MGSTILHSVRNTYGFSACTTISCKLNILGRGCINSTLTWFSSICTLWPLNVTTCWMKIYLSRFN